MRFFSRERGAFLKKMNKELIEQRINSTEGGAPLSFDN
jgi:hypothetical protein